CLYAIDRGRAAVTATAAGWLAVGVSAALLAGVAAPGGGDGPATLRALAQGTTIRMTVAGAALLCALRRALEPVSGLGGLGRTVAVGRVAATTGGLAGRAVTDALLGVVDPLLLSGLLGAAAGALVAAVVAGMIVLLADRSALRTAHWS